jgi:hypothetical protein
MDLQTRAVDRRSVSRRLQSCARIAFAAAAITLGYYPCALQAASVATDDASNYTSFGATPNPTNGGSGFGAWTIVTTGTGGSFLDSSSQAISVSTKSWALFSGGTSGTAGARRPFTNKLSPGQTFQLDLQLGGIATNGKAGFSLFQSDASTPRFAFYFVGGASNCAFDDNTGTNISIGTGGFPSGGFRVVFRLLTTDTYEFAVIKPNTGVIIYASGTRTLEGTTGAGIAIANLFSSNAGGGSGNNAYFNSFKVSYGSPTISSQPASAATCAGSGASMAVTAAATDGTTLTYAWRRRGNGWSNAWTVNANAGNAFVSSSGVIDTAGVAWGLQQTAVGTPTEAIRTLPSTLAVNQTVQVDFANNNVANGGSVGVCLQNSTGTSAFEFKFNGAGTDYNILDTRGSTNDSGIPFTNAGIRLRFTLTSSTTYSLQVIRMANGDTIVLTGTVATVTGGIQRVRFFCNGGGNGNNVYFNNLILAGADDSAGNGYTSGNWSGSDFGQSPLSGSTLGGGTSFSGSSTNMLSFSNANAADGGKIFDCAVTSGQGYTTISSAVTLTVNAPPSQTISAPSGVCPNSTGNTASVPTSSGGTYAWSISGGSITAGQTASTVTFTAGASGNVVLNCVVTSSAGCASAGGQNTTIPISGPDSTITAPASVCANSLGNTASVPDAGAGATYVWSIGGGSISAGAGTRSITFTAGASGNVTLSCTVTSSGGCSSGGSQNQMVSINPVPDSTITAPTSVCANSTGNTASVPTTAGSTYSWSITGGAITAGQNASTVTFTAGASGHVMLSCAVMSSAGCASGGAQNSTVTINSAPATPGTITQGNPSGTSVCSGASGVTYSIAAVTQATTYNWTIPIGASVTAGQGTTSITVEWGNASSGNVSVTAQNSCGTSPASNQTITVNSTPATPGTITQANPGGSTVFFGNSGVTYNISAVTGATTYNWTVPTGASITAGAGTNSITVNWGTATSGNVSVTAQDSCGTSAASTLPVTVLSAPKVSSQPSSTSVCSGGSTSMSVAANSTDGTTLSYAWRRDGNGWTSWTFDNTAGGGAGSAFLADSTEINSSTGKAWGLQQTTGGNATDAIRPLVGTLVSGQAISLDFDNKLVATNGVVGFSLQDSNGNNAFEFFLTGGNTTYSIHDNTGNARDTGISFTGTGLHLDFLLTGSNTYLLRVIDLHTGAIYGISGATVGTVSVQQVRFFCYQSGDGNNVYFNNLFAAGADDNAANYTAWDAANTGGLGTQPLTLSPLVGGTAFSGASTPTLSFSGAQVADSAKQFDCVVTDADGLPTTSLASTLTVNPLPTITLGANPVNTYGDTAASLSYTATSNSPDQYSITFDDAAHAAGFLDVTPATLPASPIAISIPNTASAGVYNATISVTNSTTSCSGGPGIPFTLTINKATPTASLSVTNSPAYNGSPQSAAVGVTTSSVPGTAQNIQYNGSSTAPTNAGTYPVTADFVPNDTTNYNGLTALSAGNFVIQKATPIATLVVTNSPVTYNGSPYSAQVGINTSSTAGSVANVLTGGAASQTNAGTYAVTADFVPNDTSNYNSVTGLAAGNFVIGKATPIVTVIVGSYTYSGSPQGPNSVTTSPNSSGTVSFNYVGVSPTIYGPSSTAPTSAGNYTATAMVAADGNNNLATSNATPFGIAQKTLTTTGALTQNKLYDGTVAATITNETLVGVVGSDDVSVGGGGTFSDKNVGNSKPVTAALVLGGSTAPNYLLTQPSGLTANITPKPVNVTADGGQFKTKGASDPTLTYTADPLLGSDSYGGALTRASGETPGSYSITIGTLTAGSNYAINFTGTNFVIAGPIANADSLSRPSNIAEITIPIVALLANDSRIASDGSTNTDNLNITAVTSGTGNTVHLVGSNVSYQALDVSDPAPLTFTYTLTDSITGTTDTGIVTVTSGPPLLLSIASAQLPSYDSGNDQTTFTATLSGTPNTDYNIEYSLDLANWTLISPPTNSGADGSFTLTIAVPGNHNALFYRATP